MGKGWQGAVLSVLGASHHWAQVTAVADVAEHYRRIEWSAPGLLDGHEPHPTMWIRLWFPNGRTLAQRAYTLVDPNFAAGTFTLEFALHDTEGPASRWARAAAVGDSLEATVYGSKLELPAAQPEGYLLVGDVASLPAINSLLGELPAGARVRLWLESEHDGDEDLPLAAPESAEVSWVCRTPGGSALLPALQRAAFDASGWFTWVATDTRATRAVKQLLRTTYRLPKSGVHGQAYWVPDGAMGKSRPAE